MQVGDIGTIITLTIQNTSGSIVNVSSATTKQIRLRKPSGEVLNKTASFTSDGSDGKIQYTTISGDLDESGRWEMQAVVVLALGTWASKTIRFTVDELLTP